MCAISTCICSSAAIYIFCTKVTLFEACSRSLAKKRSLERSYGFADWETQKRGRCSTWMTQHFFWGRKQMYTGSLEIISFSSKYKIGLKKVIDQSLFTKYKTDFTFLGLIWTVQSVCRSLQTKNTNFFCKCIDRGHNYYTHISLYNVKLRRKQFFFFKLRETEAQV